MYADENIATFRASIDAFNGRRFDQAAEAYAEEVALLNVATGEVHQGREGYRQIARGWSTAMPDCRIDLIKAFPSGESTLVAEYVIRGIHTGPLLAPAGTIPATNAQIELNCCVVLTFRQGRIDTSRTYFDTTTLLRQMGLISNSPLHAPDRRAALDLYATEVDSSLPQRNRALVHRFIQQVLNRRDAVAAADICSPNHVWHGGNLGNLYDLRAFQTFLVSFFAAFPDLQVDVQDMVAENDRVVVRLVLHATHSAEFQSIPATGEPVQGTATIAFRLANDRLAEQWWQHDLISVLHKLEAAPDQV